MCRPYGQFIAVGVGEVEPAAAGEGEGLAGDDRAEGVQPLLCLSEVVRIQDDQGTTRSNRFAGGEATREAAVGELGIGGAVVDECPAECATVKGFTACNVADVELDIVDLSVFTANAQGRLPGRCLGRRV